MTFSLDGAGVLEPEPRAVFDEGVVYGAASAEAIMTVAWLDEPDGVELEEVVAEDVARLLSRPGTVVLDREPTTVGGRDAVRTFALHLRPDGRASASEQWRLLGAGRRWTVSAMTALHDQPVWGPRLAAVAATFRLR